MNKAILGQNIVLTIRNNCHGLFIAKDEVGEKATPGGWSIMETQRKN